jgi:type I restriction enzyme S subunit
MMAELLTKGLPGRHKKFKQTEIGQVPADWSVELLDSLIAAGRPICYGVLKPGPHFEGGIPVVRITDYKGDRLDPAQVQCSAPGVVAPFARSTLAEGDILVSIRGTAGRVCVVPREIHGGNVSRDSARISIRDPDLRTFIYCYLRSPAAQGFVMGEMRGLAVKGINIEDLRRLPVPIPPPPERDTIATGIHAIDELLRASQEKLAKMAEVKSALMSVLLTGEVRVRVDEKAAA